jgi:hypothetical protein
VIAGTHRREGIDSGDTSSRTRSCWGGAAPSTRHASQSPHGTAARASRRSESGDGVAESAWGCPTNTHSILRYGHGVPRNGQGVPPNGQGTPGREHRSLTRAQRRPTCCERCSRHFEGAPTNSHRSPRSSWSIRRESQRGPSMCVGRLCKHVGTLPEERRKRSGLVGEPETQAEMPSSCARTLSVLGPRLSELAELPSVFVSTLSVFGERPSARGRMLHPFRWAPYSFGGTSSSAPTAAPPDRNDAMGEAWAALSGEGDALRKPRDALLEVRDALAIREDAVRRRERDSRRITGSSTTSPRARSISEAPVPTREAALTTQGDPSRAPRGAVDGIRDSKRGEDDAHG